MDAGVGLLLVCLTVAAEDAKIGPPAGTLSLFQPLASIDFCLDQNIAYRNWLGSAQDNEGLICHQLAYEAYRVYLNLAWAHRWAAKGEVLESRRSLWKVQAALKGAYWRGELPAFIPWRRFPLRD